MTSFFNLMSATWMNRRFRAWCITINNPTEEDKQELEELIDTQCDLGIAEMEHDDGNGTPHIQGYIRLINAKTLRALVAYLSRASLIPANGTWQDNWKYCSKEGKVFIEKGHTLKEAEKRCVPFEMMYQDMQTLTPHEFSEKYPKFWVMHREKVMQVMIDCAMKNVHDYNGDLCEKNYWIWGEAGVGKSRWAASQGSYCEIFKKNFNKWWDGYDLMNTRIVILEDYPPVPQGQALCQHMKIWGDRYPFEAECKGSHLMVMPGKFFLIVTSNYPIEQCFQNEEDIAAIKRRFRERQVIRGGLFANLGFRLDRKYLEHS